MWTRGTVIKHKKTGERYTVWHHDREGLSVIPEGGGTLNTFYGNSPLGGFPAFEDTGERDESV